MKIVERSERHFIGRASGGRDDVEMRVLIGATRCRGINDAFAVNRNIRASSIERLFRQDGLRIFHRVGARRNRRERHAPEIAGTERYSAIRDKEDLVPIARPRRLDMHVPWAEVEAIARIFMISGDRDLVARPLPVANGPNIDVEIAIRAR